MHDRQGNPIKVGDTVVTNHNNSYAHLRRRKVAALTDKTVHLKTTGKYVDWRHPEHVMVIYENTPTVVCVIIPLRNNKVLAVRRANDPGKGRLGLPGGYHMKGETWQEAGAREVYEETGVLISAEALTIEQPVMTDEYGNNLFIASSEAIPATASMLPTENMDGEVLELVEVDGSEPDWAFPRHKEAVEQFLAELA